MNNVSEVRLLIQAEERQPAEENRNYRFNWEGERYLSIREARTDLRGRIRHMRYTDLGFLDMFLLVFGVVAGVTSGLAVGLGTGICHPNVPVHPDCKDDPRKGVGFGIGLGLGIPFLAVMCLALPRLGLYALYSCHNRSIEQLIDRLPRNTLQDNPVPPDLINDLFPYLSNEALEAMHYYQIKECCLFKENLVQKKIDELSFSTEQRLVWNKIFQLRNLNIDAFIDACDSDDLRGEIRNLPSLFEGVLQHIPDEWKDDVELREALASLAQDCVIEDEEIDGEILVNLIMDAGLPLNEALKRASSRNGEGLHVFDSITFTIGDTRIPALKRLLCEKSDYFRAMFTGNMQESDMSEIPVVEADVTSFQEMIRFIQEQRCDVSEQNFYRLLVIAEKFQVAELVRLCESYLIEHMPQSGIGGCFELIKRFTLTNLKKVMEDNFLIELDDPKITLNKITQFFEISTEHRMQTLKARVLETTRIAFESYHGKVGRNPISFELLSDQVMEYFNLLQHLQEEERQRCNELLIEIITTLIKKPQDLASIFQVALDKNNLDKNNEWLNEGVINYCIRHRRSDIVRMAWFNMPSEIREHMPPEE